MSEALKTRVFLSYAASDREQARRLHELLDRRADVDVFSTDTLNAGEAWEPKLRAALAETDVFLVLISDDALQSRWVLQELGAAWGLGKRIVPVVVQRSAAWKLPISLEARQVVDLAEIEKPQVLDRVLEGWEAL